MTIQMKMQDSQDQWHHWTVKCSLC